MLQEHHKDQNYRANTVYPFENERNPYQNENSELFLVENAKISERGKKYLESKQNFIQI